jgi:hypothetical protein
MTNRTLDRRLFTLSLLTLGAAHCAAPTASEGTGSPEAVSNTTGSAGPIHPRASANLCLDVVGKATANGSQVQVWSCTGNTNQQWTYDGTNLRVYGNKCLDVTNGSTADGTKLQIWDCVAEDPNQSWVQSGATLAWNGKCLDLTGGVAQPGTLVQSWSCVAGDPNQEWSFGSTQTNPSDDAGAPGTPTKDAGAPGTPTEDAGAPGTPTKDAGVDGGSSSAARAAVLAFLAKISGNHTAIGVEDKSGGEADSDQMASMAGNGQSPSFWSADWGFGSAAEASSREAIVEEGEKQWGEGALVQYIYHACPLSWGSNEEGCAYEGGTDPIDGSFGDLSDAEWLDLTTAGGMLNGVWLARLDTLATYFQELKDAGVAPLFRPLHEINGSWAWWQGRPGSTGSALLYQITHDYLVKTKGLDNIVWVWNVQDYTTLASDVPVYTPGTSYFDVAALDVYDTGYTSGNYNAMIAGSGGKPIGIAECATMPDPSLLAQQPLWAYVAVWPDFLYSPYQNNNSTQIPELFADTQVLTLSQMPGW